MSENTAPLAGRGIYAEHGLSLLIDAGDTRLLFDAGQGGSAAHNAEMLGMPLDMISSIVLSHGHYDHTGGIVSTLAKTGPVDVYAHPAVFERKYAFRNAVERAIGIPYTRDALESAGARFRLSDAPAAIAPDITTTGEIPRTSFETGEDDLYIKDDGVLKHDPLRDDQALIITKGDTLTILLGCAHAGVINTIEAAQQMTGKTKISAIIGGMHLGMASDDRMAQTIEALRRYDIAHIVPMHCTGQKRTAELAAAFPEAVTFAAVGTTIEV